MKKPTIRTTILTATSALVLAVGCGSAPTETEAQQGHATETGASSAIFVGDGITVEATLQQSESTGACMSDTAWACSSNDECGAGAVCAQACCRAIVDELVPTLTLTRDDDASMSMSCFLATTSQSGVVNDAIDCLVTDDQGSVLVGVLTDGAASALRIGPYDGTAAAATDVVTFVTGSADPDVLELVATEGLIFPLETQARGAQHVDPLTLVERVRGAMLPFGDGGYDYQVAIDGLLNAFAFRWTADGALPSQQADASLTSTPGDVRSPLASDEVVMQRILDSLHNVEDCTNGIDDDGDGFVDCDDACSEDAACQ